MDMIQTGKNQLNDALYEKMAGEQQEYRVWLTAQPPDEILDHTAEALRAGAVTDLILCAVPVAFRGQKWYNTHIKLCCGMGRALWQTATF